MTAGILSGNKIIEEVTGGRITISPFTEDRVNPASYDLTLGPKVVVYKATVGGSFKCMPSAFSSRIPIPGESLRSRYESDRSRMDFEASPAENCLDAKIDNEILTYEMDERGLLLKPGIGYLMHTAERVATRDYVPVLDGKSSIGRLFIVVHVTAGYGDPGFDGQYTLEVTVTHPVVVYPGMRFCQIRFHTIVGTVTDYTKHKSNYTGVLAEGPVPSRAFRMFEK